MSRKSRPRRSSASGPVFHRFALECVEDRLLLSASSLIQEINWLGTEQEAFSGHWILSLDGWSGGLSEQQQSLEEQFAALGLSSQLSVDTHLGADGLFRIDTAPQLQYDDVLATVSNLAGFEYLEPDFVLEIAAVPSDPEFSDLWGLDNPGGSGGVAGADISAVDAWNVTTGSSNVVVGVVDTGIDYTHPDLAGNMWINPGEVAGDHIDNDNNGYVDDIYGWDFYNNDADPRDFRSHGTHVAGTIGAVGNNGIGVTGVNWDVGLMALKIADDDPAGRFVSSSAATAALNYVAMMRTEHGINVRVTNHSWGGGGVSTALRNAIEANAAADILLVAAAGNDTRDNDAVPQYPASYDVGNIVSVASTTRADQLSSFSNWGATSVDLAAPGSSVFSTVPGGGYGTKSGTSMATPHVAGVAALAWAFSPNATYQQIKAALMAGVDPLPALAGITVTGGRLNAARTLEMLGLNATPTSPADGAVVGTPPVDFAVSFSDDVNLATLAAGDFQVNGIAATSLTVHTPRSVTFHFAASPVTAEGLQTMTMADGAATRTSDGFALNALNAHFRYDITTLAVTSITPAAGTTATYPVTQVDITFNEIIAAASVAVDDLVLSEGKVIAAQVLGPNSVRYTVGGIETEGAVNVSLKSISVTDTFGNPMAPFSSSFELDIVERSLTNFVRVEPYGSLIGESRGNFGRLGAVGDTDQIAIDMLAGETLLAVVRPTNPAVAISAQFEGVASIVTGAPGAAVLVPLTQVAGDQTLKLAISGSGVTDYTFDLYRNALIEPLGAGNSTNLPIDSSRIEIAGTRYAMIGAVASGATQDEFTIDLTPFVGKPVDILLSKLDGTNSSGQQLRLFNPSGVQVSLGTTLTGAGKHDPHVAIRGFNVTTGGVYKVRVNSTVAGRYGLVVSPGTLFATEPNNTTSPTPRSLSATRSAVGHLGTTIEDGLYTLTIDTAATSFSGAGTVGIPSFGLFGNLAPQSPGSLTMRPTGTVQVRVQDGLIEFLNTSSLDFIAQAGAFLPGGTSADLAGQVALGGLNVQAALRNVIASAEIQPVLLGPGGEFDAGGMRIFVNGGVLDYAVPPLVTDTYDLDGLAAFNEPGLTGSVVTTPGQLGIQIPVNALIEGNVEISPGVVIEFNLLLSGQLKAAIAAGDAQDLHTISLQAGELVTVSTRTPTGGGFAQDLDSLVNVYLPGGTLLASDSSSYDGVNGLVTFLAPTTGVYTIGVAAESGYGEYRLDVDIDSVLSLVDDIDNPALKNLVFAATAGADHVKFTQVSATTIAVTLVSYDGRTAVGTANIAGVTGRVFVDALAGDDTIDGSGLVTTAARFLGGEGDDTIYGGGAADFLDGDGIDGLVAGNDEIHGGGGADIIYGDGGEGADPGVDLIYGDDGDDTIYSDGAEGAADTVYGGEGNDTIDTGGGNDLAYGEAGDDILLGGDGAEGGDDQLFGGEGRDILVADGGKNRQYFNPGGSDLLDGGGGEDLLIAGHYIPNAPGDLLAIRNVWTSADPFSTRVSTINSTYFQTGVNLYNDDLDVAPGTLADQVLGGADQDWLLLDPADDTSDLDAAEQPYAVDLSLFHRPPAT